MLLFFCSISFDGLFSPLKVVGCIRKCLDIDSRFLNCVVFGLVNI